MPASDDPSPSPGPAPSMRYPWPAVRPLSLIQGQTEPGARVPPAGGWVQPTIGAMRALMIQTEPESVPLKSA